MADSGAGPAPKAASSCARDPETRALLDRLAGLTREAGLSRPPRASFLFQQFVQVAQSVQAAEGLGHAGIVLQAGAVAVQEGPVAGGVLAAASDGQAQEALSAYELNCRAAYG